MFFNAQSVEQILRKGYYKDPDYPGEIRGTSCGDCDDGVIQFKDVSTLMKLMAVGDDEIKAKARYVFVRLQKHFPTQFEKYATDAETEYALEFLRTFLELNFDKELKSVVYFNLFKNPKERLNHTSYKEKEIEQARRFFDHFCYDLWGGLVDIKRKGDGEYMVSTISGNKLFESSPTWLMNDSTLFRRNDQGIFEVLPKLCIQDQSQIYDLVDFKKSFVRAVYTKNDELAIKILNRDPTVLSDNELNSGKYRFTRYFLSDYWNGEPSSTVRNWLKAHTDSEYPRKYDLLENSDFNDSTKGWTIQGVGSWENDRGYLGGGGISLSFAGDKATLVSQCVELHRYYSSYELSANVMVKGDAVNSGTVRGYHRWYPSSDCSGSGQFGGSYLQPQTSGYWKTLQVSGLTPALGSRSVDIVLYHRQHGAIAYWDNILFRGVGEAAEKSQGGLGLRKLRFGENLISNKTERDPSSGWIDIAKNVWVDEGVVGKWKATVIHDGDDTIKTELRTNEWKFTGLVAELTHQCFELGEQRDYQLSATVEPLTFSDKGGGSAYITWFEKSGGQGRYFNSKDYLWFNNSKKEHQLNDTVSAIENARSARLTLKLRLSVDGVFAADWSNIQFQVDGPPMKSVDDLVRELIY